MEKVDTKRVSAALKKSEKTRKKRERALAEFRTAETAFEKAKMADEQERQALGEALKPLLGIAIGRYNLTAGTRWRIDPQKIRVHIHYDFREISRSMSVTLEGIIDSNTGKEPPVQDGPRGFEPKDTTAITALLVPIVACVLHEYGLPQIPLTEASGSRYYWYE